jgi:hypothetical protein
MACQTLWGDVWPGRHYHARYTGQSIVLRICVGNLIGTFQLNANREIIALIYTIKTGPARMPGSFQQTDKLNTGAIPPDEQVRRHLHGGNGFEIGVCGRIQPVAEEVFNPWATKLPWRQTDVVNDQQADGRCLWPGAKVGGWAPAGTRYSASGAEKVYLAGLSV